MFRLEIGTFLLALGDRDIELRCFGRVFDALWGGDGLSGGVFYNHADDPTKGRHWRWCEMREKLAFWR